MNPNRYQNGMVNYRSNPVNYKPNEINYSNYHDFNESDERMIFPFLLGGVTGAALAPAFWNRPNYYAPYPVPYYQGYYPYRRW